MESLPLYCLITFPGVLGFCCIMVPLLVSRYFGQVLYQSHYFGLVTTLLSSWLEKSNVMVCWTFIEWPRLHSLQIRNCIKSCWGCEAIVQ